jgi:hypothetical protein
MRAGLERTSVKMHRSRISPQQLRQEEKRQSAAYQIILLIKMHLYCLYNENYCDEL